MVGCCWCTTSSCYQDKDKIEYYVGRGNGNPQNFGQTRAPVNGSDYDSHSSGLRRSEEQKDQTKFDGDNRRIRWTLALFAIFMYSHIAVQIAGYLASLEIQADLSK